jgi:hypothetical protein
VTRAGRWAARCAGRSASRAASTRSCSRRPRPRTARRRRASRRRDGVDGAVASRTTATGTPSTTRPRSACRHGDSASLQTCASLMRRPPRRRSRLVDQRPRWRARRRWPHEVPAPRLVGTPIGRRRRRRSRAPPARGLVGGDAARLQVEQLLVVEPAGGAGVPGADDLAGLDLEVGHRVGAGAVGEHEVAVELVGVGADRAAG